MSIDEILLGSDPDGGAVSLRTRMANRHGLIAGATGTGKTVTLQVLAEGFSKAGVPVFLADVKGDLSGLAGAATADEKLLARASATGVVDYRPAPVPTVFWDLFGRNGHPVRATISDMGPLILGNLMELNETQSGVLYAAFRIADDQGLLLLDLKDLRAMLGWISTSRRELQSEYGSLPSASVAAIQRRVLVLEEQGASQFFGEPTLDLADLMRHDFSGLGVVSVLDATSLMPMPRLYTTFLLWLLSELFEQLPEVGDVDRPGLVFFFDEAHLLFDRAPRALLDKIEQVVRLIRSKGVGVYFVSQNPMDIPEDVLGQLGNRVQHALRAYTPKDQRAVRAAAQTFRPNPALDTAQAITELKVGEALVSTLDDEGAPTVVQRTRIRPPASRMGALTATERRQQLGRSPLSGRYDQSVDRESAYELLKTRAARTVEPQSGKKDRAARSPAASGKGRAPSLEELLASAAGSAVRSIGTQFGRQLARGLLGSLLGGRR